MKFAAKRPSCLGLDPGLRRGDGLELEEDAVADTTTIKLTSDELEMLVDALEADMEGYLESAREARGANNRDDHVTFTEAATRIQALLARLQDLIED